MHLLAYLPDPTYPPLVARLARILDGRDARVPGDAAPSCASAGSTSTPPTYAAAGAATATGRPHVADALVALGAVDDRDEAFDRYLARAAGLRRPLRDAAAR